MPALFTLAVLLGAALLFVVEPMAAKMVLPQLGGSPAVWNTCMVFFQAGLLAGYAYAHLISGRFEPRAQVLVHSLVLAGPLVFLPVTIGGNAEAPAEAPVRWLLGSLVIGVGAPFAVLATTGPLLQSWFSSLGHGRSRDPYFLYAASNAGSLAGLLGYPFLIEPWLPVGSREGGALSQSLLWSAGYGVYAVLVLACGVALWRRAQGIAPDEARPADRAAVPWRKRLLWLLLAFVPSSLMLGATQYLTTDIAAVPLLWVLPLALYLLTFILAFSPRWRVSVAFSGTILAILALAVAVSVWVSVPRPSPLLAIPLHLMTVLAAGLLCHGRLYAERPSTSGLTEYYLWIALGGCAGGIFNALVAPALFPTVIEYPLAILLACLLRPERRRRGGRATDRRVWALDVLVPLGLALLLLVLPSLLSGSSGPLEKLRLQAGIGAVVTLPFLLRPLRYALAVGVLLGMGSLYAHSFGETLWTERTFFGVSRVRKIEGQPYRHETPAGNDQIVRMDQHALYHGTTRHGTQLLDPRLRYRATTYFHISGPVGHLFRTFRGTPKLERVAVVGLGAGTLAVYGEPGQRFTFYEIDPAVVRIARDDRFFTYLRDGRAQTEMVLGDGRLQLSRAPDGEYGLIVLDAFSSDAMPVHLITREAVETYFRKLEPDGILMINLTSEYFDLLPVLDAIAADLRLRGLVWEDLVVTPRQRFEGKDTSRFAVLARDPGVLEPLWSGGGWQSFPLVPGGHPPRRFLWTDDSSSVLSALRR